MFRQVGNSGTQEQVLRHCKRRCKNRKTIRTGRENKERKGTVETNSENSVLRTREI